MIDKKSFLERLDAALVLRCVPDDDAAVYIAQFDRFYDRLISDPEKMVILEDVDLIADNIVAALRKKRAAETAYAEGEEVVSEEEETKPASDSGAAQSGGMDEPNGSISPKAVSDASVQHTRTVAAVPENAVVPSGAASEEDTDDDGAEDEYEEGQLPEYMEDEPAPNSTLFWVLFGVTLPITLPLVTAVFLLFVAMWAVLFVVIAASVAALVALAAGGTALALVGIVYGITQLFDVMPIGLFEIGLGVVIGGCVIFFGILLYNFAIRLIPVLVRLVARLFVYTFGQLKKLFNFLRRECAKQ